jgi:hypothetical protein
LSFANIEACLTRPHAFALTVLLWHGGTVAAVAALCALTGRRWLRWPDMTTRWERGSPRSLTDKEKKKERCAREPYAKPNV